MPMAIPLMAAAFTVAQGIAIGSLVGGLMVAGGALTAVGTLTHNQKLTKIGGVLSMVGGVGSMVGGLTSGASSVAGDAASEAITETAAQTTANDVAAELAKDTASNTGSSLAAEELADQAHQAFMSGGPAAQTVGEVASGAAPGVTQPTAGPSPSQGLISGAQDTALSAPSIGNPVDSLANSADGVGNFARPSFSDYKSGLDQGFNYGGGSANNTGYGAGDAASGGSFWDSLSNAAGKLGQMAKDNPELYKTANGLIQGAAGYASQRQQMKDKLGMQMKYDDWVRQRYNDSLRNLQIPGLVQSRPTGAGSTQGSSAGIIAGSRG